MSGERSRCRKCGNLFEQMDEDFVVRSYCPTCRAEQRRACGEPTWYNKGVYFDKSTKGLASHARHHEWRADVMSTNGRRLRRRFKTRDEAVLWAYYMTGRRPKGSAK